MAIELICKDVPAIRLDSDQGAGKMACENEKTAVEIARDRLLLANEDASFICQDDPASEECRHARTAIQGAQRNLAKAAGALAKCRDRRELGTASGLVNFLRVHRSGSGFGGGVSNILSAEVIFKLENLPHLAFGFELQAGDELPSHEAMLAIVRDAFLHNVRLHIDFLQRITPPNQNCEAVRVWMERSHSNAEANLNAGIGPA